MNHTDSSFTVLEFRPFDRNTLKGFLRIQLPSGLIINGLTLHQKGDSRWISPPAKEYTNADGERAWSPIVEFSSKQVRESFQVAALEAIDAYLGEQAI